MDAIRASFILRNCLREVPDEILFMILEVYVVSDELLLCACCGVFRDTEVKYPDHKLVTNYKRYLQNSKKRFEEKSWEVCFYCWTNYYRVCYVCCLPFGSSLYSSKTTTVKRHMDNFGSCTCVGCNGK